MFSYPIYLWHIEVGIALNRLLARWVALGPEAMALRWACGMSAFLVLSVVIGVVMGRLVERPALAMRDRLFPAPADGPASAGPENGTLLIANGPENEPRQRGIADCERGLGKLGNPILPRLWIVRQDSATSSS